MANMNLRISFFTGCDGFPGFIQLDRQLLHAFMSISGMSQRPANGDPLSLPFFPLQQLLAGISQRSLFSSQMSRRRSAS